MARPLCTYESQIFYYIGKILSDIVSADSFTAEYLSFLLKILEMNGYLSYSRKKNGPNISANKILLIN